MSIMTEGGRATSRPTRRSWRYWFFLVPMTSVSLTVPGIGAAREAGLLALVGLVVGVLWQVVHPRDLAGRLLEVSLLGVLCMGLAWLPGVHVHPQPLEAGAGILCGLVLTTDWQRSRRSKLS